jgi:hypothetical protein
LVKKLDADWRRWAGPEWMSALALASVALDAFEREGGSVTKETGVDGSFAVVKDFKEFLLGVIFQRHGDGRWTFQANSSPGFMTKEDGWMLEGHRYQPAAFWNLTTHLSQRAAKAFEKAKASVTAEFA